MPYAICHIYAQNKIVAIVNNDIITQKDLNDFMNFMRIQLSDEYADEELEEKIQIMKVDLLNKLIEDRLILQEAKKNNIKINENRVKAKINEIKSRYPYETEFQNALTRQGLVQADIEVRIREQLLMYHVVEQKVRQKIVVRPEEVTAFYNTNKKELVLPEARELEVTTLENENLAKTFADNFKKGEKLEDLATKYPITLNQLRVLQGEELRKDIEEIVFNLKIGEVSDPVKVDDKYYIFKLNNIIPPKQLNLSEVQDKINAFLFDRKFQEELKNWLDELKEESYIKILQD
jgi:parvulin-like peptidyl-prolyl isomerase